MIRPRKLMREFTGTLKDKASLIKVTLTTKRTLSSIKIAILRATTHRSAATPPEHRLEAILSLGWDRGPLIACACIDSIMDRLHSTQNPHVALKCLLVLHNVLARGSFLLKEQLSYYPSHGGRNSLNVTRFGQKNAGSFEDRELSEWVRWYASVVERNLISSKTIGCYLDSASSVSKSFHGFRNKGNYYSNTLLKEIDTLVCMVEGICSAPETLHYQKMDSVHELMLLVSEDYRYTQHHIIARIQAFDAKIDESNVRDWLDLACCLKRLGGCRERLAEMFGNRKRNDAFWDLISRTVRELEGRMDEEKERGRSTTVVVWKQGGGETTSQGTKLLTYF